MGLRWMRIYHEVSGQCGGPAPCHLLIAKQGPRVRIGLTLTHFQLNPFRVSTYVWGIEEVQTEGMGCLHASPSSEPGARQRRRRGRTKGQKDEG